MNVLLAILASGFHASTNPVYFVPDRIQTGGATTTGLQSTTILHNRSPSTAVCSLSSLVSSLSTRAEIQIMISQNPWSVYGPTESARPEGNQFIHDLSPLYGTRNFSIPSGDSIEFKSVNMGECYGCLSSQSTKAAAPTTRGQGEWVKLSFKCGALVADTLNLQVNSFQRYSSTLSRTPDVHSPNSDQYQPNGRPASNTGSMAIDRWGSHLRR